MWYRNNVATRDHQKRPDKLENLNEVLESAKPTRPETTGKNYEQKPDIKLEDFAVC